MKRFIKLLFILLMISALAGITTSCGFLSNTYVQKHEPYKHKQPLPKKYVINNGYKPIVK